MSIDRFSHWSTIPPPQATNTLRAAACVSTLPIKLIAGLELVVDIHQVGSKSRHYGAFECRFSFAGDPEAKSRRVVVNEN